MVLEDMAAGRAISGSGFQGICLGMDVAIFVLPI